jgi:hypothetical protein
MISLLIYQATDVALYYLIGFTIYLWAYKCGEEIVGMEKSVRKVDECPKRKLEYLLV